MSAIYKSITRICVRACCIAPMHIGGGEESGDVLVKDSLNIPFIQGTSLAGSFANYIAVTEGAQVAEKYFGNSKSNGVEGKSKIVVSEGFFDPELLKIEMRTRVSIDGESGSVKANSIKGSDAVSGQVMDVEYISAGNKFDFEICAYDDAKDIAKKCLAALNKGIITIGGLSTIGCGRLEIESCMAKSYDMTSEGDRKDWARLSLSDKTLSGYEDILNEIKSVSAKDTGYELKCSFKLRTPLLIKANSIDGKLIEDSLQLRELTKAPDNMPIYNGRKEFIIPGSSLKGVFRNRMEMISKHIGIDSDKVTAAFDDKSDCKFSEAVISNSSFAIQPRIHIDKFTGAVINKSLFTQMTVSGDSEFVIRVNSETEKEKRLDPKAQIGLLLYTLRDFHIGAVSLGGGADIGRGMLKINEVCISKDGEEVVSFAMDAIPDNSFIKSCLAEAHKG